MKDMEKNINQEEKDYVGIDVSKRSLQVVRHNSSGDKEWLNVSTDEVGLKELMNWLHKKDKVGLEAGSQSFYLAKKIIREVSCEVIALNPGDLATIYASLKKTDKEDALKIARMVQRIPRKELPEVALPTDKEERIRKLVSEQSYWSKQKTNFKNRLHSIFSREGFTRISKKHLNTQKSRLKCLGLLKNEAYHLEAERLVETLGQIELTLKSIDKQVEGVLKENIAHTKLAFSMPGIGPIAALTILGYMGNFNRFSSAKQVSNYSGLVPKISISGEKSHYGHIIKRGCKPIKRVILQSAWSLVRSPYGGKLSKFYRNLAQRAGKKKAAVALARKMLETLYHMSKNRELYRYMPEAKLENKLKVYGIT